MILNKINFVLIKKKLRIYLLNFFFFRKFFYNYKSTKRLKIFNNLNLNKNSIFLDFGGHEGIFSYFFLDKFNCKIEIYEPSKFLFEILKKKFKKFKNVSVHNLAVSNKSASSKLYFHKKTTKENFLIFAQSSSLISAQKENISKNIFEKIKTINLKKILNKHKFIDVIKIDIEGAEYKILDTIILNMHKIGIVYCELNGKPKNPLLENKKQVIIKKLKKKGYWNKKFIEFS